MLRVHILIERTVAQLDFHSDPFFGPQSGSLLIKRYHGFLLVDGKGRPHLRPVILPMQLVKTIQSLAQQMKTQQVLESDRPVRIVNCQQLPHFQQICRHGILSAFSPRPPFPAQRRFFFHKIIPIQILPPFSSPFFVKQSLL